MTVVCDQCPTKKVNLLLNFDRFQLVYPPPNIINILDFNCLQTRKRNPSRSTSGRRFRFRRSESVRRLRLLLHVPPQPPLPRHAHRQEEEHQLAHRLGLLAGSALLRPGKQTNKF